MKTLSIKQKKGIWAKQTVGVIASYSMISFGTVLMAAGIYFFKFPNHFSTGGVSSLAIILGRIVPLFSEGQYMAVANLLLLIIGLLVFGRNFAFKTVYCSVLLSILTRVFEVVLPLAQPLTNQKMLELVFAIGLTAAGSALIFNEQASSGGTDIVAMILKRFSSLNIGKALLCSDAVLAVCSFFIFDTETGMFSVLGLVLKALVVDNLIDGINLSKCFTIIADEDKAEVICEYIKTDLHRGATVCESQGAFRNEEKRMIITVLNRGQAILLKRYIAKTDPHAFTVITNSSDVLGKGFRVTV